MRAVLDGRGAEGFEAGLAVEAGQAEVDGVKHFVFFDQRDEEDGQAEHLGREGHKLTKYWFDERRQHLESAQAT